MKPILKWAGGKAALLPELLRHIPATFGRYIEPFLGGGALFFHLAPERAILGDVNRDLIATYEAVRADPAGVSRWVASFAAEHDEWTYYAVRDRWNAGAALDASERAAMLIYLNRTCYNGLWRVNASGGFNVPMGDYKAPAFPGAEALAAAAASLVLAELRAGDYQATADLARPGDLVYFDPPYDSIDSDSFTNYAAGGFGRKEQAELAWLAIDLGRRGVSVIASNADTPFIRGIYGTLPMRAIAARRSIAASGDRTPAAELIICAGPGVERGFPQPVDNL